MKFSKVFLLVWLTLLLGSAFAQSNSRGLSVIPMGNDVVHMTESQRASLTRKDLTPQIAQAEVNEQVDIVVFYRNQYAFYLGADEVVSRIEDLVNHTNQVFRDSDISVELNLVSVAPASSIPDTQNRGDSEFIPDTNLLTAFQAVTFDTIISNNSNFESDLIRASGTDLFALVDVGIDTELPSFAGIAFLNGPLSVSFDFGLTLRRGIFAHEIGHNFGGGHEIEDDPTSTRDNHATTCAGLRTALFSTVSQNSTDTFSNPDIQRNGEFCGEVDAADNTRNINASAAFVMNFGFAPETSSSVAFTQASYQVNEQDGILDVTLSRTGNIANSMTLVAKLTGGTAQAEIDFFNDYQFVRFDPNQNLATVSFPIVRDAVPENTETALVELLFPIGGTISQASANVSIENGSNGTAGNVNLVTASSITSEAESVEVSLQRTGGSDGELLYKLDFVPSDVDNQGNQARAMLPEEMNRSLQFVLFADGETTKTFSITPLDDELEESTEVMRAALYRGTSFITAQNIFVTDNDSPNQDNQSILALEALEENEFNNNRASVPVTITRTGSTDNPVTAIISVTGDGRAVLDQEFVFTISADATTATIIIPLVETPIEQDTVINLTLASPDSTISAEGATLSFTLLADEVGQLALQNPSTDSIIDTDGTFTVEVARNNGSDNQINARVFVEQLNVDNAELIPAQSQELVFADGASDIQTVSFVVNDISFNGTVDLTVQLDSAQAAPDQSTLSLQITNAEVTPPPPPEPPAPTPTPNTNNDSGGGGSMGIWLVLLLFAACVRLNNKRTKL